MKRVQANVPGPGGWHKPAIGLTHAAMYQTPDDRPIYRLLTGKDDRAFCERVSEALAQGWRLYGSPTLAWDTENSCMKAAQAVVWHEADVVK